MSTALMCMVADWMNVCIVEIQVCCNGRSNKLFSSFDSVTSQSFHKLSTLPQQISIITSLPSLHVPMR